MPDLIRHPVFFWIPASAGMTTLRYFTARVISVEIDVLPRKKNGQQKINPAAPGITDAHIL